MKLENLSEGEVYKSYRELCKALEEKYKTGNAKIKQVKEWERHCSFMRQGNKYIIAQIYDHPLPVNRNETISVSDIEKLILDYVCYSENGKRLFISRSSLLKKLQMINKYYTQGKYRQVRLSEHTDISLPEIEEFYLTSETLLKRNLEKALNSLRGQSLIYWSKQMTVCFLEGKTYTDSNERTRLNKVERINEFGEEEVKFSVVSNVRRVYRESTKEEREIVLNAERIVLDRYNCISVHDAIKKGIKDKFYKEVRDIIFTEANIYLYFDSYDITINEEYILSKWKSLNDFITYRNKNIKNKSRHSLNEQVIIKVDDQAIIRAKKALEFDKEGKSERAIKRNDMRLSKDYITNSKTLSSLLINKKEDSLDDLFNL